MPGRLTFSQVKKYIEELGCELLSDNYVNNKTLLSLKCKKCDKTYKQSFDRIKKGYIHPGCEYVNRGFYHINVLGKGKKKFVVLNRFTCPHCKNIFYDRHEKRVYCSNKCFNDFKSKSDKWKEYGSKGGKVANTERRSKNEIEFCNMCIAKWGRDSILDNVPIFDGFDTDIVIPHLNVAIEWNGIWHYKKVKCNHKLKQVQARDKVKSSIITKKYGYILYVIKDMGGHNIKFVKSKFDEFVNNFKKDTIPSIIYM